VFVLQRADRAKVVQPWGQVVDVTPAGVTAGAWSPLQFTIRASEVGVDNGTVVLTVPTGWATPSTSATSAGHVAATAGVVKVTGRSVELAGVTLAPNDAVQITYGGGPGGATEPTVAGKYGFAVSVGATSSRSVALARPPSVAVRTPAFGCRTAADPSGPGGQLALPNGTAQANLYNIQASSGSIKQCFDATGLSTVLAVTHIAPKGQGPAGYPEVGYGYDLEDHPFCQLCHTAPFPIPVSRLSTAAGNLTLNADYSLSDAIPASMPRDLIYDVWLEKSPSAGTMPHQGDVELAIFLYEQSMATCNPCDRPSR